jgi:uncharacterized protein DUF481
MPHRFVVLKASLLALVCSFVSAPHAFGQAPAAQPPPVPPPAAPTVQIKSDINVGANRSAGVSRQFGLNLSGGVLRRSPTLNLALDGDETYAIVEVQGVDQTVADAQNLKFTLQRPLTPRTFLMFRPAYKRNSVQSIDYRFEELAGAGFRLADTDTDGPFFVDVVGVGGAVQQHKNIPAVDGGHAAGGFYENVNYEARDRWRFDHFFLYLRQFKAREDYRLQVSNSLTVQMFKHVGLNASYSFDHENVVLAGEHHDDRRFAVSLNFTFAHAR